MPCFSQNEIIFPMEPPQNKLKNYKRSWKRHIPRGWIFKISSFHVSFTHIYPIRRAVNDHWHLEPCMTTKWKKHKLLTLLGTNQWKKQVTAFTGTN